MLQRHSTKGIFTNQVLIDWRTKFPGKSLFDWVKEQVIAHNDPETCLIWPFTTNKRGYGYISIAGHIPYKRKKVEVHRLAYFLKYGVWPEPQGRHTCHDTSCFSPLHIVAGTNLQNSQDKLKAGRQPRGERIPWSKLTDEQIRAAHTERIHDGTPLHILAKRLGVNSATLCDALNGRTWKHLLLPR